MKLGNVYRIMHNGDVYIGSTFQTLPQRWGTHLYGMKKCPHIPFYQWLKDKHDKIEMELLDTKICYNKSDLLYLEDEYIKKYQILGYNVLNDRQAYRPRSEATKINLKPLKCPICGTMTSLRNLKRHQASEYCIEASKCKN